MTDDSTLNALPIFACEALQTSSMGFRCPHCKTWHAHDRRPGPEPVTVPAECWRGPLRGRSYAVFLVSEPFTGRGRAWAAYEARAARQQERLRARQARQQERWEAAAQSASRTLAK